MRSSSLSSRTRSRLVCGGVRLSCIACVGLVTSLVVAAATAVRYSASPATRIAEVDPAVAVPGRAYARWRFPGVTVHSLLPTWPTYLPSQQLEPVVGQAARVFVLGKVDVRDNEAVTMWCAGFPLRCVCGWQVSSGEQLSHLTRHWIIDVPRLSRKGIVVPCRPMALGLLGNSMLYAVLWWMLFLGSNRWRRTRRVRNGLCEQCRYPLGHSNVCTECGAPRTRLPRDTGTLRAEGQG